MMELGLLSVKCNKEELNECEIKTNCYQCKVMFGVLPTTMCSIYQDLQTSTTEETDINQPQPMRLKGSKFNLQ